MTATAAPRHITRVLPGARGTVRTAATFAAFVLLLGGLAACSTDDPSSTGAIATYMAQRDDDGGTVRLADAYEEGVASLVVVCPYNSGTDVQDQLGFTWPDATELRVEEHEQVVVAARDGEVVDSELMSRQVLDLCADPDVDYPLTLDPDTSLEISMAEWSDGTDYPVAELG